MTDRQVLLRFAQRDSKPFYSALDRYKKFLIGLPEHGLLKECQLQNFLDGLNAATQTWVERGNGTASLYQLSADEVYWFLEDMADYDNWCWNHSPNNQG